MNKHIILTALLATSLTIGAQVSRMEQEYMKLADRFEQRDMSVEKDLRTYLQEYPYTTYADEVYFMTGVLKTERGYYKQALKELEKAEYKSLSRPHQPAYQFYRGYTNMMQQEFDRAVTYFGNLRKEESPYKLKANYYYAYSEYKRGQYEKALPALLELEPVKEYQPTVPYFLVQVYYAQKEYDEVSGRAEELLNRDPENENNSELHRILGEIYYQKGDYPTAISHLSEYETSVKEQGKELVRNDIYLLGIAEYRLGEYEKAIQYLKQVSQQKDTISESTCLALGNAYVKTGQTEQAKLNYHAAMQYRLTPAVREEAMYNYALTTYQSSTAIGESVSAFTDFLKEYPDSKYVSQIFELMSDAFRRSKNYSAALAALDSIPKPNRKMLDTKQYLRYQLGTDAYVQGKHETAGKWFTEVINNHKPNLNRSYLTESYYWRAEVDYRLKAYNSCRTDLNSYYSQPDVNKSPNLAAAKYLSAYNLFSLKDYTGARDDFEAYTEMIRPTDATFADALNRIGDCYFNSRDFDKATANYSRVIDIRGAGSDYAMFQKGYAQGLQRRYQEKIKTMQQLTEKYPKSDYADDALYETARAYLQLENEREGLQAYEQLLKKYPKSNMARKASIERAMMYHNLHMNEQAIAAFKQTIEQYPGSEEAYTALEGLESVYVETNNINEYVAFTQGLGQYNMSTNYREDSLRYTAHYLAASTYYQHENYEAALSEYKALSEITGNPYMTEANIRIAELSYDKKDYQTALVFFSRMQQNASDREQKDIARLGILRCNYNLNRIKATIDIATEILLDEPISDNLREEALYNRGKSYVADLQYSMAIADLRAIAKDTRTSSGAEAKYLVAECMYKSGELDNAEAEIMSFAQMNTQQQYWLAKALILLSDIYVKRGDLFQARQYLLTIQRNYGYNDDIPSILESRLSEIDAMERPQEQEEDNTNDEEESK